MSYLPPRVADTVNAPLMQLLFGDLTKLGLKKMPYGPFEEIKKDGTIPVLDIGTIKHIRKGHIHVYDHIERIEGKTVHFIDSKKESFDAIVAAIGYYRHCHEILQVDKSRAEDLQVSVDQQKYFGKDGLYFCGFYIGPRGQIREIGLDALKIASDIAKNSSEEKSNQEKPSLGIANS
jgi:hypothetical protein